MGQAEPSWAKLGQAGQSWAKLGQAGPSWGKLGKVGKAEPCFLLILFMETMKKEKKGKKMSGENTPKSEMEKVLSKTGKVIL